MEKIQHPKKTILE